MFRALRLIPQTGTRSSPLPLGFSSSGNSFGRSAMDRSFYEARWVLVPMFVLMLMVVLAGAMLG